MARPRRFEIPSRYRCHAVPGIHPGEDNDAPADALSTAEDIEALIRSFGSQGSYKTSVFVSNYSEELPLNKT